MKQGTIAIFDFDKTISRNDTYLPFLWLAARWHPWRFFLVPALPFAVFLYYIGAIDNGRLKCIFLRVVLGHAAKEEVRAIARQFVGALFHKGLHEEAVRTIGRHKALGHRLILASASFDFYIEPIARLLGFDECVCTRAGWSDAGRLSGAIDGRNCHGEFKLHRLMEAIGDRSGLYIVCYSDHHSDLPLLQWSDKAYMVNPTRVLENKMKNTDAGLCRWD